MNEELQKQLAEIVRKSMDLAEKTGGFIMDQAPDLLREFYQWKILTSIYGIIVSIILIVLARYLPKYWLSTEELDSRNYDIVDPIKFFGRHGSVGAYAAWILFGLACLIGGIGILNDLWVLIQILVTPKMYIINYFLK